MTAGTEDRAAAVAALDAGQVLVLASPTGDSHLLMSAAHATAERIAFLVRHSSGFLCAVLDRRRACALGVPPMFGADRRGAPVYGVAVDASVGTATGISAMDRALTLRLLGSALSGPADFTRPGHVMPLLVEPDGERHGDGEHAALVAARLVGLGPAGGAAVLATLVSPREPIRSASCEEAQTFADDHGLVCVEMNAPDGRDLDRRSTSSASVFG